MTRASDAFDDLLATGRQELAELAGGKRAPAPDDAAASAPAPAPGNPSRGVYQGTAGGTPFRLKVK